MNNQIKLLRKHLGLTLEEFGKRLGVTRAAISNIENGNRNVTEQMIVSICREFGVNEDWLRNGDGEMFEQLTDKERLMKYTGMLLRGEDSVVVSAIQALIITYEQLDDSSKATLEKIAMQYIENFKKSQ